MKLLSVLLSFLFFTFSLNAAVETGATAPDFTLSDTTGAAHSLSDFKGKYVVLEWTNHECPFVKKFYKEGHMQAMQEKMTAKDVVWLQIVSSAEGTQGYVTAEEGEALRTEKGHKSTAMLLDADGKVGRIYDARTTPHIYLIDPEGTLIYQGAIDSIKSTKTADIDKAENYLKLAYEAHLKGQPVATATTKPYGCSVKYAK